MERKRGYHRFTVQDLVSKLLTMPQDSVVLMPIDPEENSYNDIRGVYLAGFRKGEPVILQACGGYDDDSEFGLKEEMEKMVKNLSK